MEWILGGLILVLIVMGISSAMGSYASAQQAQAQIETARAAQFSAAGGMLSTLVMLLVLLMVAALLALGVYIAWRRLSQGQRSNGRGMEVRPGPAVSDLVQLEVLRTLREMRGEARPALPEPRTVAENLPVENWMESLR